VEESKLGEGLKILLIFSRIKHFKEPLEGIIA